MSTYVGKDDFVFVKHTGEIARVIDVYTYEWSLEWLDGTTGRLERDDFIPVNLTTLWVLAGTAPQAVQRAVVLAAQHLDDE